MNIGGDGDGVGGVGNVVGGGGGGVATIVVGDGGGVAAVVVVGGGGGVAAVGCIVDLVEGLLPSLRAENVFT